MALNPEVKKYLDAFKESVEYVEPYWTVAARLYQLWRGKRPPQLNGTFSQIMLNVGHSVVQDRVPKLMQNLFADEQIVSLQADDPAYEGFVEQAEGWVRDMYRDESKLNILANLMPTLQSTCALGTGYRMPCVRPMERDGKWEMRITAEDVDFFQIIPAPVGGQINPIDRSSMDAIPYFFHVDWMTDDQIKAYEKFGPSKVGDKRFPGYLKDEARKMFDSKRESGHELENAYVDIHNIVGGVSYNKRAAWMRRMQDLDNKASRRRVVHWYSRGEYRIIVQDAYLIYHGPNPMKSGILPLTKWSIRPDFKNWFGISPLEMVEDIIIAWLMNFNYRMDHLIRVMFPTKWIRKDVMGTHPSSYFHDRPYAVYDFPTSVSRFSDAVHYDRAPEITPQSFLEEDRFKYAIQMIDHQPDYSKGMGGRGTLANETASGILALIRQSEGPLMVETMLLEYGGLAQEVRLLLSLAEKHIGNPVNVKVPTSRDGFKWQSVDPDALADVYTVRTNGMRYMSNQEQEFQKLMALYPIWNQRPTFDQAELDRQVALAAKVLPNVDKVLRQDAMAGMPEMGGMAQPEPGGMASAADINQRTRSVAQRTQATGQPESPMRMAV